MNDVQASIDPEAVVLLVDDDADCRQLVRDAISQNRPEVEIHEAASGEEALQFLARAATLPSLIFLDLEMPGLTGLETLRLIRTKPEYSDMAVVMMTGVTADEPKTLAMRAGANSFTNKPVEAARFFETVRLSTEYWLKIHQQPGRALKPCAV